MSLPLVDAIDPLRDRRLETRLRYMPRASIKERPTLDQPTQAKPGRYLISTSDGSTEVVDHADIALLEGTLPPGAAAAVVASAVAAIVAVADPPSPHPTQAATTSASAAIVLHAIPS